MYTKLRSPVWALSVETRKKPRRDFRSTLFCVFSVFSVFSFFFSRISAFYFFRLFAFCLWIAPQFPEPIHGSKYGWLCTFSFNCTWVYMPLSVQRLYKPLRSPGDFCSSKHIHYQSTTSTFSLFYSFSSVSRLTLVSFFTSVDQTTSLHSTSVYIHLPIFQDDVHQDPRPCRSLLHHCFGPSPGDGPPLGHRPP